MFDLIRLNIHKYYLPVHTLYWIRFFCVQNKQESSPTQSKGETRYNSNNDEIETKQTKRTKTQNKTK